MLFSKNGEVPVNSLEKSRKFVQKYVCQLNQQAEGRQEKSVKLKCESNNYRLQTH